MTTFPITLEEREFPSDRVISTRTEEFEPGESGQGFFRRVEPYLLSVRPFIAQLDAGLELPPPRRPGPMPLPWGRRASPNLTAYSYLFTIWGDGWTREADSLFFDQFPPNFVSYYVAMDSRIPADTVHTHAVSLRTLRVLETSPLADSPDGIVSTAEDQQRVSADSPLRGQGTSEGVGGPRFLEWEAWTDPPADTSPLPALTGGAMTLKRNAVGRAVALYGPSPGPPGQEPTFVEAPRLDLTFEEYIRRIAERGDADSVREATHDVEQRLKSLNQMRDRLKERLTQIDE